MFGFLGIPVTKNVTCVAWYNQTKHNTQNLEKYGMNHPKFMNVHQGQFNTTVGAKLQHLSHESVQSSSNEGGDQTNWPAGASNSTPVHFPLCVYVNMKHCLTTWYSLTQKSGQFRQRYELKPWLLYEVYRNRTRMVNARRLESSRNIEHF